MCEGEGPHLSFVAMVSRWSGGRVSRSATREMSKHRLLIWLSLRKSMVSLGPAASSHAGRIGFLVPCGMAAEGQGLRALSCCLVMYNVPSNAADERLQCDDEESIESVCRATISTQAKAQKSRGL